MAEGLELIQPTELYNILNQSTRYCALSDPNYLLLLDARFKGDYSESHVITAKKVEPNELPYEAEVECKRYIVVYDSNTRSLEKDGPAVKYGRFLWDNSSKNPVKILNGGYEDFSAAYPFLRTQKMIIMPRELDEMKTYPTEILPAHLYLANKRQANDPAVHKDLKIKGLVNCSPEPCELLSEEGEFLFNIPVEDTDESDLYSKFESACSFIDGHILASRTVLVSSDLGISRSAALVIAYLMHHHKWSLQEAYEHTLKCCHNMRPLRAFVRQLSQWEEDIHGSKITDIDDPKF